MSETIIHNQIRIVSPSAPVLDASAMSEQVWRALALSLESIAAQIVEAQRKQMQLIAALANDAIQGSLREMAAQIGRAVSASLASGWYAGTYEARQGAVIQIDIPASPQRRLLPGRTGPASHFCLMTAEGVVDGHSFRFNSPRYAELFATLAEEREITKEHACAILRIERADYDTATAHSRAFSEALKRIRRTVGRGCGLRSRAGKVLLLTKVYLRKNPIKPELTP